VPRDRSYSISCGMNWTNDDGDIIPSDGSFVKSTDIRNPGPSQALVFIDMSANSVDNNEFPCYNAGECTYLYWKLPTSRHDDGSDLSFADGHVEHWKWYGPYINQDNQIPDSTLGGGRDRALARPPRQRTRTCRDCRPHFHIFKVFNAKKLTKIPKLKSNPTTSQL
ncbi:MAG: hypothetical protein ACREFR_18510, partial [Limisphaerales bacterium]